MPFEFHLPSLEKMRSTTEGLEMIRMSEYDDFNGAVVSGCPGSGKTTISIRRLIRLNEQQKKVKLVTYQNLLVRAIRSLTHGLEVPKDRISTFHKWYYDLTNAWFDSDETADKIKEQLQLTSLSRQGLHEIIVDEGQDLPLCVYQSVPDFTERIFVGADDGQQVHPKQGARTEQIEKSLQKNSKSYRRFILGRNFRNTYETYRFARQFMPHTNLVAWDENMLDRLKHSERFGPKPRVATFRDLSSRDEDMLTVIKNADGNIAVLCPEGKKGSKSGDSVEDIFDLIQKMGVPATKYYSDQALKKELESLEELERCIVTTYKSAKGLEFDTVIIPRINYFKNIPEEWYVACTRTSGNLFIYQDIANPYYDPILRSKFDVDTYEQVSLSGSDNTSTSAPF